MQNKMQSIKQCFSDFKHTVTFAIVLKQNYILFKLNQNNKQNNIFV